MKYPLLLSFLLISPITFYFAPAHAAEFFVDSNVDARDESLDGRCRTASGVCTLRAALEEASVVGTADIIHLPAGTFSLTTTLEITDADSIVGAGAALTIIEAGASHRVFHIRATSGEVKISRATIRNGNAGTGSDGGALYVDAGARLLLTDVVVTANRARDGGGIYSLGALTLVRTEVFANTASDSDAGLAEGGGVYSATTGANVLLMQDSYVHDNVAEVAGGVFVSGIATIERNTLAANRAQNETVNNGEGGGGIVQSGAASRLLMVNSTVSGNRADGFGGGLVNRGGTANLYSVTIADNIADANNTGGTAAGGGIYVDTGTVNIESSILARNQASASGADCRGTLSSGGYNIVGTNAGCTFALQGGDRLEAALQLDDLRANGGFAPTRALPGGSPAIDPANHPTCTDGSAPLLLDQRGSMRPVNRLCDIGAYEASGVTALAGSDQTVRPRDVVSLDGRASSPANGIRSYAWQQIAGPTVTLSNANSAVATFTAPASATTLVFRLTVTDTNDVFHSDEMSVIVTTGTPVGQYPGGIVGPGQGGGGTGGYGGGDNGGCALRRSGTDVDLILPVMLLAAVIGIRRRTKRNAA